MNRHRDAGQLFAAYESGGITPEQLEILELALREDYELRLKFAEYMKIDSETEDLAALSAFDAEKLGIDGNLADDSPLKVETIVGAGNKLLRYWHIGFITLALILVAISPLVDHGDSPVESMVVKVNAVDAALVRQDRLWEKSDLSAGEFELWEGLLHLQFKGNVMVFVEGPAQFKIVTANRLLIQSGRLSVSVPPEGTGFTVETPHAEVFGSDTECSIEVALEASEVHVFQGPVQVRPHSNNESFDGDSVDLQTAQALMLSRHRNKPTYIDLATDRFIRSFSEPQAEFSQSIRNLKPVAYYRMPISQGVPCEPPEHSGELQLGEGTKSPRAPGVIGGSLLVGGKSSGRGAVVRQPPQLVEGELSVIVSLYAEEEYSESVIATNRRSESGNFTLLIDKQGRPCVSILTEDETLVECVAESEITRKQWCHLVVTLDGEALRLNLDGRQVGIQPCPPANVSEAINLWIGTDGTNERNWEGRIDELAFFDRALSANELAELYRSAKASSRRKNRNALLGRDNNSHE